MDSKNLPIPKLEIFQNIKIRQEQKANKEKKKKKKYLDQLFKNKDEFLKKYFE
tara:strand:+ start:200 stop:358 length:159 start_codon:yes stop_codon:yes gene_type:complete